MSAPSPAGFLVDAASDPVAVRVQGRASFQNSACLQDFINAMMSAGRTRFAVDFHECTSMDSTFLGVLAGAALKLRKLPTPGSLVLCRLSGRNLELVRNLGLDRLLTIDDGRFVPLVDGQGAPLKCTPDLSELQQARLVLTAHEDLVQADEANRQKFQDVLTFLKQQVEKDGA
jgi:anti-anti-sigma factor